MNRWSGRYDFRAFVFLCWSVAESPAFAHLVTLTILMIAVVIGIEVRLISTKASKFFEAAI